MTKNEKPFNNNGFIDGQPAWRYYKTNAICCAKYHYHFFDANTFKQILSLGKSSCIQPNGTYYLPTIKPKFLFRKTKPRK